MILHFLFKNSYKLFKILLFNKNFLSRYLSKIFKRNIILGKILHLYYNYTFFLEPIKIINNYNISSLAKLYYHLSILRLNFLDFKVKILIDKCLKYFQSKVIIYSSDKYIIIYLFHNFIIDYLSKLYHDLLCFLDNKINDEVSVILNLLLKLFIE